MHAPNHSLLRPALLGLTVFALAAQACAAVSLAPLFRDGAVLQQGMPVPVWGRADAGETVRVTFGSQHVDAKAGADGRWLVHLAPLDASAKPAELVAAGSTTLRVRDVLVGEVWLCSGQSNMARTIRQIGVDAATLPGVNDPLLRHFKIPDTVASLPADTVAGEWTASAADSAAEFSAVSYFFARELRGRLGVPVGLVNSSWGGTQIESWMSPAALAASPAAAAIKARWQERLAAYPAELARFDALNAKWEADRAAATANGTAFKRSRPRRPEGAGSRWEPGAIHNAMIHPLLPAALRGVIWYQGETNAPRFDEYRDLFPRMIGQWRADFGQPRLPFYFVQLANLERSASIDPTGRQWAFQREAQTAALKLPATGMAVTIDIGDPADIHPANKQDVGLRLALLALAETYRKDIPARGPRFERAEPKGAEFVVHFACADGLAAGPGGPAGFEIAGADRVFHPAQARVQGNTVLVSTPAVAAPVAVRYAFKNNPAASLKNRDGLPAEPFRSDAW